VFTAVVKVMHDTELTVFFFVKAKVDVCRIAPTASAVDSGACLEFMLICLWVFVRLC